MNKKCLWGRAGVMAALLLLVTCGAAVAQLQSGNLYGKVLDTAGATLPGVTLTLDTGEAPQVQVSNAQGEFRFLALAPGNYKLKAELQGFSTAEYPNIVINVGRNTSLEVTLNAAIKDVITVTAESPLLDERKVGTGNTVSQTELQKIPTSRDPWSVLKSTPGVQIDRVNVGGNESGQQANYIGPGSQGDQSVWSVDGVVITDMSATGSSPAYYDFDSFQEMQVTTGGSDSSIATGGVVLNLVTKRGTNEWRGSARFYDTDKGTQSNSGFSNSELAPGQPAFKQGNRIVSVRDYGAELGGPLIKDRLWAWGSYGDQKVSLLTISNVSDKTNLPAWNAKLSGQISPSNSATLFSLDSNKTKNGRNAGPSRPQETTWNQSSFGAKPTLFKAEDTQNVGSSFYLTGRYSFVNGGFELVPQGGLGPTPFADANNVWHNSYLQAQTKRPQKQGQLEASSFFNTGSLSHELKYGAGYRQVITQSSTVWPGVGYVYDGSITGYNTGPYNGLYLIRAGAARIDQKFYDGFAEDTLTSGNLTANIGLRYDLQKGHNLAASVAGNSLEPGLLPAASYAGGDQGFQWKSLVPRLGLTYALGNDRKTLLRFSYSRFADQLSADKNHAEILNPLSSPSYYYGLTTNNTGGTVTPNQFVPGQFLPGGVPNLGGGYKANVNIVTGGLLQGNAVNPSLSPPKTDEFILGFEHALLPEFVVGITGTYRRLSNLLEYDQLVYDTNNPLDPSTFNSVGRVATRDDYIPVTTTATLEGGQKVPVTYYVLKPGVVTHKGVFLTNGNDEQTYKGGSLVFTKRLSDHWMARGNFTYSDWYWSKIGDRANPTILVGGDTGSGTTSPDITGGAALNDPVLLSAGTASGSKNAVYVNSKWSYNINGLYQVAPDKPWAFNVAGNLSGRQGYYLPFRKTVAGPTEAASFVQVLNVTSFRLPSVNLFDTRIEKEFAFNDFGLTLGADCFNLFNSATVLQRKNSAGSTAGYVSEIMSPRIFRFGARISLR